MKVIANAYNNEIAVINQKEQEALAQLGLTEDERKSIRDNAAAERKAATARNYDEQIQIINDKEKLLLSNIELTEEQITQIQLTAEDENGWKEFRKDLN